MSHRIGQHLGNYQLTQLIGSGGFAEVYLGMHRRLNTPAAIKILRTAIAQQDIQQFQREAQVIASLHHPHIVRVFDFDVQDDMPFLVMDYAPNGPLTRHHPEGTRLPLPTVIDYTKQLAQALQYAHDQKLIHRDLKPANILLGHHHELLLSDFGIATMAHNTTSLTTQSIAGTAPYMAPEQLQGRAVLASDQYALGIIVYQWLCGVRPFNGSATEIGMQHLLTAPPPLRQHDASIPPHVEQVVLTALAKDPHQRFASVRTFATALENALIDAQQGRPAPNVAAPSPSGLTSTYIPSPAASALPPTQPAIAFTPPNTPPIADVSKQSDPALDAAYEGLRQIVEAKYRNYLKPCVIIVRADETQIGQVAYVLAEREWIRDQKNRRTANAQVAYIKHYQSNGQTISAAIFPDLYEGDYMVWIDINQPRAVSLNNKEAIIANLRPHSALEIFSAQKTGPVSDATVEQSLPVKVSKKSSIHPTDQFISTQSNQPGASLNQAYETLRKKMQKELEDSSFQIIIIQADASQMKRPVYILAEDEWIKEHNQSDLTENAKVATIKRYTVNGQDIAAVIFKDLMDHNYIAWIDINKPIPIAADEGEARLVDLQGIQSNSYRDIVQVWDKHITTSLRALSSPGNVTMPSPANYEAVYVMLHTALQAKLEDSSFQIIIIQADPSQVGQKVYVIEEEEFLKEKKKSNLIESAKAAHIKLYQIGSMLIATAVFRDLMDSNYMVWINTKKAVPVFANEGEAIIVDMRGKS